MLGFWAALLSLALYTPSLQPILSMQDIRLTLFPYNEGQGRDALYHRFFSP